MTEIEPLQPQRQFAAIAFALLAALSLVSTLAWNVNVGRGRPEAAALLSGAGFANVVNLRDGFESWRSAGLPTASNG